MRHKIPSTITLINLESTARHESFTKAVEELSLTQNATCRQIVMFGEFLGIELLRRSQRGVKPIEVGLSYSRRAAARLDVVERGTLVVVGHRSGDAIGLAVASIFGTQ